MAKSVEEIQTAGHEQRAVVPGAGEALGIILIDARYFDGRQIIGARDGDSLLRLFDARVGNLYFGTAGRCARDQRVELAPGGEIAASSSAGFSSGASRSSSSPSVCASLAHAILSWLSA